MELFVVIITICLFQLFFLLLNVIGNIRKRPSNKMLVIFLVAQLFSFCNILLYYYFENTVQSIPYLFNISLPFAFTWAPSLYLYIRFEVGAIHRFSWQHSIHFSLSALMLVFLVFAFHLKASEAKRELLNNPQFFLHKYYNVFSILIMLHVFIYNILSIVCFRQYAKSQTSFSKKSKERLLWNRFILYAYFAACLVYNVLNLLNINELGYKRYLLIQLAIFTAYFTSILYRAMSGSHFSLPVEKKSRLSVVDADAQQIKSELERMMVKDKLHLELDLTIAHVAEKIRVKERVLSEVINRYDGKNFYEYVNCFRIEEAKGLLKRNDSKKTVLEIVYASGFNSKSAFNYAFKKQTGLTPTQFRQKFLA